MSSTPLSFGSSWLEFQSFVRAAEACYHENIDDEVKEMLRLTPRHLIVTAKKTVSPLPQS